MKIFEQVLTKYKIPYLKCTTWSTDGYYRETKEMVEHRIKQGCQAVEMECSADGGNREIFAIKFLDSFCTVEIF